MSVIETNSLCKSYGKEPVLHGIDMQITEGRLTGFLGPNGAGKTTTIRILMGLLPISSGSARIFDLPVDELGKKIRADVGYLPGDVHLYSNLTGLQLLKFYSKARRKNCLDEAIRLAEAFELDLVKNIRRYSTGMRQKLGLIQALMHKPSLLILDEPTSALDPLICIEVTNELRKITSEGRTVLFSSHSLHEVESLCDEVIILRDGHIVEQQQIEVLKSRALRKIQLVFSENVGDFESKPNELKISELLDNTLTGTWSGPIKPLLHWIEKHPVIDVIIERPDLNDLFIGYYSDSSPNS